MAWLELRASGLYHIGSHFEGQKFKKALHTRDRSADHQCLGWPSNRGNGQTLSAFDTRSTTTSYRRRFRQINQFIDLFLILFGFISEIN